MANDPSWPSEPAGRYSLSTLLAPAALMRLGIIALVLLGVASAFAWTAGWLSPGRLDQVRLIDTFEAVNGAQGGDALVGLDVPVGAEAVAEEVGHLLRDTDRVLLILPRAVRVLLPAGGEEGVTSVLERIREAPVATGECQVASVIVQQGEHGAEAFERLKNEGLLHPL